MATLSNLHKSILDMDRDECLNLIKNLRASRRINKGKIYIRSQKKAKQTKVKQDVNPLDLLKSMKKEDISNLIKMLEELE